MDYSFIDFMTRAQSHTVRSSGPLLPAERLCTSGCLCAGPPARGSPGAPARLGERCLPSSGAVPGKQMDAVSLRGNNTLLCLQMI